MSARRRFVAVLLTVALVSLGSPLFVGAASAAAGTWSCEEYVTADVVLSHNLDCPDGFTLIIAPGVTVDLGGHTIRSGQETGCAAAAFEAPGENQCDVTLWGDGATLRNGRLINVGFLLIASADVERMTLEASTVYLAGGRFHENIVKDSWVQLQGNAGSPTVSGNWLSRTPVYLFNVPYGVSRFEVSRNILDHSPSHGLEIPVSDVGYNPDDVGGSITDNLIVGSVLDGIRVSDSLFFLAPLEIARNVVVGSGGNGITVNGPLTYEYDPGLIVTGGPVTVKGNQTHFNSGQGIGALTGEEPVVDGGGNRAMVNRVRPPCTGVKCNAWPWWR